MTGRSPPSPRKAAGFTLLEVLVALVIATTASTIILMHLSALIDLNERIRTHRSEVSELLNQAEDLNHPDWGRSADRSLEDTHIAITLSGQTTPSLFVSNFELATKKEVAPIDQAYTPFQTYRVQPAKRYSISLLYPNLPLEF